MADRMHKWLQKYLVFFTQQRHIHVKVKLGSDGCENQANPQSIIVLPVSIKHMPAKAIRRTLRTIMGTKLVNFKLHVVGRKILVVSYTTMNHDHTIQVAQKIFCIVSYKICIP
jgi:hypothetical protein